MHNQRSVSVVQGVLSCQKCSGTRGDRAQAVRLGICPFTRLTRTTNCSSCHSTRVLSPPEVTSSMCTASEGAQNVLLLERPPTTKLTEVPKLPLQLRRGAVVCLSLCTWLMSARVTLKKVRQGHGGVQHGCLVYNCGTRICESTNCHKHSECQHLFSFPNVVLSQQIK